MEKLINVLELASELAERDLILKFGGEVEIYKSEIDGVTTFTDEMQDRFNILYEEYSEFIEQFGGIDSDNHSNSYGVFCMANVIGESDMGLDVLWGKAIQLYSLFVGSKFNVDNESELDGILNFYKYYTETKKAIFNGHIGE